MKKVIISAYYFACLNILIISSLIFFIVTENIEVPEKWFVTNITNFFGLAFFYVMPFYPLYMSNKIDFLTMEEGSSSSSLSKTIWGGMSLGLSLFSGCVIFLVAKDIIMMGLA